MLICAQIVHAYRPSTIALACLRMTLQSMDVPTGANTVAWLASIVEVR